MQDTSVITVPTDRTTTATIDETNKDDAAAVVVVVVAAAAILSPLFVVGDKNHKDDKY